MRLQHPQHAAAPTFSNAAGFLKGAGDIRKISMLSRRTGERVNTVYWIEGEYIPEALKEINYLMRDWRRNEVMKIDVRTIDIIAASHSLLDTSRTVPIVVGLSQPPHKQTMLRSKSRSVAKNSLHMLGKAADLRLGSRSVSQDQQSGNRLSCGRCWEIQPIKFCAHGLWSRSHVARIKTTLKAKLNTWLFYFLN